VKVVVVGGGLAGMATALGLLDSGSRVELIEQQPALGGNLSSWVDADGDHIASGLHWYSRGDTTLLRLLERAGLADRIRWGEPNVALARPGGATAHIPLLRLPSPLNVLAACAANDLLTPGEKLLTALGLATSWIGTDAYVASLDSLTYTRWHREHRIPQRVLQKLVEPIARSLGGLPSDELAARPVVALFQRLAIDSAAGQFGTLDGPTSPRLIEPFTALLSAGGATIRTNTAASQLQLDRAGVSGIELETGEVVRGDAYILALQPHSLRRLLPSDLRGVAPFSDLWRIGSVPTICVQFWLDRYVHYGDRFYLTADACFSSFGDLALASPIHHDRHAGSLVAMSVAPAAPLWHLSDEAIIAQCRGDLQRLWPAVRGATLRKSSVIRLPNALYRAAPGVGRYLPQGPTPLDNLFLAGDWTASDGAPSLEGAARSGSRACAWAHALMASRS